LADGAPQSWDDVRRLAAALPAGKSLGLPLAPVHAFASFYTLCSQIRGDAIWSDGSELDAATGEATLGLLQELLPALHPQSLHDDPIAMSQRMSETDELVYCPLVYGYSNYARSGFAPHVLRYADIPSDYGAPRGSMLGGVGLAVSARCLHAETACRFVQMAADGAFQRTVFVREGGQPGHRAAWLDPEANRLTGGFFANTLRTLDEGSVRPRFDGYIAFQEQAGTLIRDFLAAKGTDRKGAIRLLNRMLFAAQRRSEG
jgi:multiple sugar transport system substrate-binding protein